MKRLHGNFFLLCAGLVFALALARGAEGATAKQWKARTIYQVLTDRFATSDGSAPGCDLSKYCGGSWKGISKHLDYIQGMGFDAIWISPIVANTDNGYHGYWASDFGSLNPHFGTASDLASLRTDLHTRGMYLMVDVVANHPGPVGYSYGGIRPFNSSEHYHDCNGCPSDCNIRTWTNQPEVEHCRLSGLPDLNQTNAFVRKQLISLIKSVAADNADGLRVDTVPEVEKSFWAEMQSEVGVFAMGEVYDMRTDYVAGYQGPLDSVLSYPMFNTMRDVFGYSGSMRNLATCLDGMKQHFKDVSVLGTFMDNHDQTRFLNYQSDRWRYRNALVWTLYSTGIPIVYYGSEQGYAGGSDPKNREALWSSKYDTSSELYTFLKTAIAYRKKAAVWNYEQVERWQDDQFYAFTRGDTLVVVTNVGGSAADLTRTITYHPYKVGTKLCNAFWPNDDCITVTSDGVTVKLLHGEPKVYYPVSA